MQGTIKFFGGKKDGDTLTTYGEPLQDCYKITLDEPGRTPCTSKQVPNAVVKLGIYHLRELWCNGRPSHYMYVYEDSLEEFEAKFSFEQCP